MVNRSPESNLQPPSIMEAAVQQAAINENKQSLALLAQAREDAMARAREVHTWRRDYADKVYRIIRAWLIIDVLLVAIYGFGDLIHFTADKSVIIAFITSATVTVLGLFAIVMRWLFPGSADHKVRESNEENQE